MAAAIRKLAGDTVWYGISSILSRMISYFMVPLYTAVLEVRDYGIVTELYAYIAFFLVVYTYGMETTYFRYATKGHEESITFNVSFSTILTSSLAFSGLLCLFSTSIVNWLQYPGQEEAIYYMAGIITIDALVSIPYARLRLQNRAKYFAYIKLTQVTVTLLLNVFFLLVCYPIAKGELFVGWQSAITFWFDANFVVKYVFMANLLANGLILLLLLKEFYGYRFTLRLKELKPMLIYSMPLLFMGLAAVTNEMFSRTLLKRWLPIGYYENLDNQEALAVFGAVYKLSIFIQLGIQAFRYAAEPFFFSKTSDKSSPKLFSQVMTLFVQFNAVLFLAISVNLDWLGTMILRNETYLTGLHIVPYLLLGYLFSGVYYNLSVWYKVSDKTHFGAIITTIGAIITVFLNYVLIPIWGYFGSAVTTLAVFFGMSAISYVLGQKHHPIPYDLMAIFEAILLACVLVVISEWVACDLSAVQFLIKNSLPILLLIYLYLRNRKYLQGRKILGIKMP